MLADKHTSGYAAKLKGAFLSGTKKGWGSFLWICSIIVPVSFLVMLLQWSGWLHHVEVVLKPLMGWLNLPSEAALPIISGMAVNVYASIAAMTVLPFSIGQMTLIAVFVLTAHNLIMEGIIQHRSGTNAARITLVRLAAAVVTVICASQVLGDTSQSVAVAAGTATDVTFLEAVGQWALDALILLAKILGIIVGIMIALESMTSLGWTDRLFNVSRPLMKLLGLPDRAAMLWVTAAVFGLMYGGAVIQEKARQGDLSRAELERLHISIGINHSMVEDPFLFMALGLNGLWILAPKLVMAVLAVHFFRLVESLAAWFRGKRGGHRSQERMAGQW